MKYYCCGLEFTVIESNYLFAVSLDSIISRDTNNGGTMTKFGNSPTKVNEIWVNTKKND